MDGWGNKVKAVVESGQPRLDVLRSLLAGLGSLKGLRLPGAVSASPLSEVPLQARHRLLLKAEEQHH